MLSTVALATMTSSQRPETMFFMAVTAKTLSLAGTTETSSSVALGVIFWSDRMVSTQSLVAVVTIAFMPAAVVFSIIARTISRLAMAMTRAMVSTARMSFTAVMVKTR